MNCQHVHLFVLTEDFDSFLVGPPPSFSLRLATELFFSFLPTWGTVSSSESELESVSSFFLFRIFLSMLPLGVLPLSQLCLSKVTHTLWGRIREAPKPGNLPWENICEQWVKLDFSRHQLCFKFTHFVTNSIFSIGETPKASAFFFLNRTTQIQIGILEGIYKAYPKAVLVWTSLEGQTA